MSIRPVSMDSGTLWYAVLSSLLLSMWKVSEME